MGSKGVLISEALDYLDFYNQNIEDIAKMIHQKNNHDLYTEDDDFLNEAIVGLEDNPIGLGTKQNFEESDPTEIKF